MATYNNADRIQFLDGLRGTAILLVIVYHAFARWTEVVPYGDALAGFPLFVYGSLGVQLFFMISGFVIFLTLDKCGGVGDFFTRRWLRLFPAMLICSLFIWFTAPLMPERPAGPVTAYQLIPGITFIDEAWFRKVGLHTKSIEGAFWSIFVEVQFYILVGLSYFLVGGRRAAIAVLLIVFSFALLRAPIENHFAALADTVTFRRLAFLGDRLRADAYGWFATGALLYIYRSQKSVGALILGIGVAAFAVAQPQLPKSATTLAAALVALLFVVSIASTKLQSILSQRVLLILGYISYPLYLLHENMMVALIVKVGNWVPGLWPILMPVAPVLFVLLVAWIVAAYVEPPLKMFLQHGLSASRKALQVFSGTA